MNNFLIINFVILFKFLVINFCIAEQNFYLSADKIIKDDNKNLITAEGGVEVQKDKVKVNADSLQYDSKKEEITLEGNIKILYEDGSVVFADKAKLNKNLNTGIIRRLGILMADDSRLVASSAKKYSKGHKTVYKDISYTRCDNCKNNSGTFWKINAKKATHLEKSQVILYENVFLEVIDFPVFYFPFFYYPDPSVQRKTGLLAPSFSRSNVFGLSYEQPIFWKISSKSDLTVKTKFTEEEGLLLKNNFRLKSETGEFDFKSSVTRGTKVRANETSKKENRGHFDINFANNLGKEIIVGGNIKKSSDKSYLSRYQLSDGETLLTQNLFIEKQNAYSKFSAQTFRFQSLSDDYLEDNLPFIRPMLMYEWNNLGNSKRTTNFLSRIRLKSVTKKNKDSINALYFSNNSERTYIQNNIIIKQDIDLNLDFYKSRYSGNNYQSTIRAFPTVGFTTSYPIIKYKNEYSVLLEPVTQLVYTVDDNKNNKVQNVDSLNVELLSSNFLTKDKYSGDDRREHGLRINYGLNIKFKGNNGAYNNFLLGRSYYEKKQEQFNIVDGFKSNNSDFVGNYTMFKSNGNELYYDFRISENLDLNRNRIRTNLKLADYNASIDYIQIKNFASRDDPDTELLSYGIGKMIFSNWKIDFYQYRDLAGAHLSTPFKSAVGLTFENDCAQIKFNITRDKSYDIDIPSTTNYNFTINLF